MIQPRTTNPSPGELLGRAAALVPLLRENAVKAEQLRRLPDVTIRAVEEAGLFRMLQPVVRGGYGTDAATLSKVMTLIASGCASTTWVMSIYSSVAQHHLGYARMADAPVVQAAVARAAVDIKLIESFQQYVLSARTGGAVADPSEAAVLSLGSVRCLELARGIIERLFSLAPSTEIHRTKSLQRLLRDVHVFEHRHAASPFINYELHGRRFFAS